MDKYVEVTGGQAAYDAVKTRIVKADVTVPAVGMTAKMELYAARPDQFYSVLQVPAGNMERGWNGEVAWMSLPGRGVRILRGAEKVAAIRDSTQDRFGRWRKLFQKADYVGEELVGSKPYSKVVLTPKPLDPEVQESPLAVLLDPDSGLIKRFTTDVLTPQGPTEVTVILEDYQPAGNLILPRKMTVQFQGIDRTMKIHEVTTNAPIPAEKLALPDSVREAMQQAP
jgi:hypothetical protein